ncbi:DUF4173 domain-containing protein [Cesiribacter sp. SM1]|uniref:DUF4153 domain-containing protein n=1 Tax=Cesiribacter sp. SM1 TaxID=2861196 RepID=UPI001CD4AFAA|nr:DUF4173 domain-containing protein [Cesiribacter sp. SM1]
MKNIKLYFQSAAALAGTWLLYEANWGLNAFLLSLIILGLLVWSKRIAPLPALLFGFSGVGVALSASALSLVLFWLLLFVLIGNSQNKLSWPTAIPEGISSLVKGGWLAIRSRKHGPLPGFSMSKSLLLSLPPLGITLIFYALYANASPVFASKASLAQLHLPDFSWFLLFFCLLWGSFALAYAHPQSRLEAWDARQPDVLLRRRRKSLLNPFWLKYEFKTALLVLGLLNALLLLFHSIDITTLLEGKPGGGTTYAEWVHQGVGTLIVSIVMAVALLVYVFRGNLNFFRQNQSLLLLAKVWIVQNAVLASTTALKNSWYIASYGLTYKRIGVWVYLILVLIGLISTWIKITEKQTLWWMFTRNFKATILVLLLVTVLPWARIITWYNLEKAQITDNSYLLALSLHNTDQLLQHNAKFSHQQQLNLHSRRIRLVESTKTDNWKSWTFLNYYAKQNLETIK